MTYSIDIQPYNDPYVKIAEEALRAGAELLIPGAFLVDIIPILKYAPEWFPGAKFQSKAAMMRKHAARIRNTYNVCSDRRIDGMWFITFFSEICAYILRPAVTMTRIPPSRSSQRH